MAILECRGVVCGCEMITKREIAERMVKWVRPDPGRREEIQENVKRVLWGTSEHEVSKVRSSALRNVKRERRIQW